MPETTALTFTDDQLLAAIKAGPPDLQQAVNIIAMQLELLDRRAADLACEGPDLPDPEESDPTDE